MQKLVGVVDKQGCCHLIADSSSAAEGKYRVIGTVTVLLFCKSVRLYEGTHRCSCSDEQGCCHLIADSSGAAEGKHRVLGMVAAISARLYSKNS